jgi:flagellum-specific peptidoglycan hydrolase FlgJ
VHSVRKPTWQQATALVSLSTCGAMTGFAFAHGTVADMTSPTSVPVNLLAFDRTGSQASASNTASSDSALRAAIVSVARNYLQMAQTKTPAEMEALIWQADSADGVDHGQSCAAFASLTLALGAQAVGQQSWVTGGGSYPWPLQQWADVRVQPNPASLNVVSMQQDAQAHHRWHPAGDGYRPQPGDWVLFDGHVEVVTRYTDAALYTVGGDSLPNLTVNAHKFSAPLAAQGVLGFVNNGDLSGQGQGNTANQGDQSTVVSAQLPGTSAQTPGTGQVPGQASQGNHGSATIPGMVAPALGPAGNTTTTTAAPVNHAASGQAPGTAAIPGAAVLADTPPATSSTQPAPAYTRHHPPPAPAPGTAAQQAFISQVAPGAIAAQQKYGIPASVTIAQAIDESGWGQSALATADHNLFGIKGTGPAGRDMLPTQEYENGIWVTRTAAFRVYHNIAQSIADHGQLLAASPVYRHAMNDRHLPDAFASDLTGIYATDPSYGASLIALMKLYHLYQYDTATPATPPTAAEQPPAGQQTGRQQTGMAGGTSIPGLAGALTAAAVAAPMAGRGRGSRGPRAAPPAQRREPRIVPRGDRLGSRRYIPQIPKTVTADFTATAKAPLIRAKPLYQDVAGRAGIRWELLAACDWMQCQADPRYSPVHGEKLGTVNPDGTSYRTKSEALGQCASDLTELAEVVYQIKLTGTRARSVRELASVFAAFRWGGLLEAHGISAMEFPYSVAGLTSQHLKMRWPDIREPRAPDKPGARFRMPFGAVPVVLSLGYRAQERLTNGPARLTRAANPRGEHHRTFGIKRSFFRTYGGVTLRSAGRMRPSRRAGRCRASAEVLNFRRSPPGRSRKFPKILRCGAGRFTLSRSA